MALATKMHAYSMSLVSFFRKLSVQLCIVSPAPTLVGDLEPSKLSLINSPVSDLHPTRRVILE